MLTFGCSDGWRAVCAHSALLSVCVHVSTGLVGPGPSLGLAPARAGADLRLQQRFSLRCIIQLTRGQTTGHCVSLEGGGASDNIIMEADLRLLIIIAEMLLVNQTWAETWPEPPEEMWVWSLVSSLLSTPACLSCIGRLMNISSMSPPASAGHNQQQSFPVSVTA